MPKSHTSAQPRRSSTSAPPPAAQPAEARPGEHAPDILPTNPFTVTGLEGYFAELRQIEGEWFHQKFMAKMDEQRYKEFQLGRSRVGSLWYVNIERLKDVGCRHGVADGDPRVYSIASYRAELKVIEDTLECLVSQNGWTDTALPLGVQHRHAAHVTDCEARHFPVPGGTGRFAVGLLCGGARVQSPDCLSRPLLWRLVEWGLQFLDGAHNSGDDGNRVVCRIYGLMHELGVDWAPDQPYPTLTTNEARDRLRQIAHRLEREEGTQSGGHVQEVAPNPPPGDTYVTLDQVSAYINRSKRTLERRLRKMPDPEVVGGNGKPHEWRWSVLRPWLQKEFDRELPERFPTSRV
jgi:hypothetical protein